MLCTQFVLWCQWSQGSAIEYIVKTRQADRWHHILVEFCIKRGIGLGVEYHIGGGRLQYICLIGCKILPADGFVTVSSFNSFVYFLSVLYVGSFGCYWLPKYLFQLAKSFTILIPDRVRGKNQRNPDRSRHGGPVQQVLKDKICSRSRVS